MSTHRFCTDIITWVTNQTELTVMLLPSLDTAKTNYTSIAMSCSRVALIYTKQALCYGEGKNSPWSGVLTTFSPDLKKKKKKTHLKDHKDFWSLFPSVKRVRTIL